MSQMQLDPMSLHRLIEDMKNTEIREVELDMPGVFAKLDESVNESLFGSTADVFYDSAAHCKTLMELERVVIPDTTTIDDIINEISAGLAMDLMNPLQSLTSNLTNYIPVMNEQDEEMFI